MAWRALLRRIPTRSMTIVGDLAQATGRGAPSWDAVLDRPLRGAWRASALTVNYRTPASIMDLATAVAAGAGHPTSPVRSVRDLPDAIRLTRAVDDAAAPFDRLAEAVVEAVRTEVTALDGGTVAVVAARTRRVALEGAVARAALGSPGLADAVTPRHGDPLSARVVVLDPVASKGLEFDVVILVEPVEIAEAGDPGTDPHADGPARRVRRPGPVDFPRASDLYVAMTRATRRLHVVHARDLPPGFAAREV